jgi:hypothetical protein
MANIFNSFENLDFNNLLDEEMWGGSLFEILCSSRAFSLSGTPVALRSSRQLIAASGNITLSGTGVILRCTRKIASSSRQFVLSGTAIPFIRTRKLVVSSGHVTLLGSPVGVPATRKITNVSGFFTLAGSGIGLSAQRKINADHGVFNLLGSEIQLMVVDYPFYIDSGALVVQGHSMNLLAGKKLVVGTGAFYTSGLWIDLRPPFYPPFRPLDTLGNARSFGNIPAQDRGFSSSDTKRAFGIDSSPSRSFEDNINVGRY